MTSAERVARHRANKEQARRERAGKEFIRRDRAAWLAAHPSKTPADYDKATSCAATDTEYEAMRKWQRQQGHKVTQ